MKLRREPGVSAAYERLFEADPDATVFHHPDFLRSAPGIFRGRLEMWWLGDSVACPVILNRRLLYTSASSLGYGCYGGPVGDPAGFPEFFAELKGAGLSRIEVVDFRNRLSAPGFVEAGRTAHIIQLPETGEGLRDGYSNLRKRDLKKEVGVEESRDAEGFFRMHRETYKQARVWFTPLEGIRALLKTELARLYMARVGHNPAGGLLVLSWKDSAMWWINGWDRAFESESPMTHLLHRAMSDAVALGRRLFNLGGTDAAGPARFKESLGARPYPYRSLVMEKPWVGRLRRLKERMR